MLDRLREHLGSQATDTISRTASLAAAIVLLLALAYQSMAIYRTASFTPSINTVTAVASPSVTADYEATAITRHNLFGRSTTSPDQLRNSNLPTTDLAIVLRGVFTSSNPREASAIIERPDGVTRSYKVSALLFGQTRLHAVFNDRIVLSTNGQLETLYFPDPTQAQESTKANSLAINQLPDSVKNLVEKHMSSEEIQQTATQLSSPTMTPDQRKALIRQRLLELRNRAREQK